jgi:uncharacterized lipoprotein YajG
MTDQNKFASRGVESPTTSSVHLTGVRKSRKTCTDTYLASLTRNVVTGVSVSISGCEERVQKASAAYKKPESVQLWPLLFSSVTHE